VTNDEETISQQQEKHYKEVGHKAMFVAQVLYSSKVPGLPHSTRTAAMQ
jgi:hypothetical protein